MARVGTLDPLTRYKYLVYIEFQGNREYFTKLGFMSVTAPRVSLATSDYIEGGRHLNPRIKVDSATFSPVTLRRGKTFSKDFMNWIGQVWKAFYGDERQNGESENYRATIVIDHIDRRGNVAKKYILSDAVPVDYIPASNFDAMDDSEVSIETLTFRYEGYAELSLDSQFLSGILGASGSELLSKLDAVDGVSSLPKGFDF